ncbi:alpha/beta fold hydrolase [Aquirufa antheringensis]|jgi:pimeloyl-ACP methyl ester carboxylesterase|uniref:Alpha/beta hydrolase n=1 Tax=Aquirufa antheringensis TaxID=2516559 RepID=A0A4Q9BEP8_9BACT|nr:alpha/beta hydrolase [Aquirufa antheringensis]MCZ2484305.1 alpha/beta hydrolase [Aquirufa antheringensis]MCZ2487826.1 alpha/beta hydrolase [Aquirufa antheringensis]MCZ2489349.1 alpha/beta hydrolase [Aquirufa antheringensis]TBH74487.1 alpha/beta hydrolase [Aquirufa antheringensis]
MKTVFFLLIVSLATFGQKQIPYGNNPQAGKYAAIRGFQMYYEIYGKGEPLLLIHGNNGSIQDFKNQIPTFSKSYQVIIADNRSHGKSIDRQDSLSYEQMADDFTALLDHLKLDSVNVIGWSDGGINGLLLASRHPKKVRKLAVTGANLTPEPVKSTDAWVVENEFQVIDSLSRLPLTGENKRQLKLHRLLVDEPHISHAVLNKIQCPTLVIGGDHDVIMPRHTLEIAEAIPRSYLWILPNSGHSTPIAYKELFNSTILEFLKKPYRKIEKQAKFY